MLRTCKTSLAIFVFFLQLWSCPLMAADTIPPILTIIGPNPLKIQIYCTNKDFKDPGATAFDAVDGNLSNKILVSGTVNTIKVGIYTVQYSVSDSSGNKIMAQRTVIVEDKMAPEIIFDQNPLKVLINYYDYHYTPLPKVWDDSCINPSLKPFIELVNTNVNKDVLGTYTETWRVSDAAGNISDEKNRIIEVVADLSISKTNTIRYTLFPNPVSNILNIDFGFFNKPMIFKIYDTNGRLILNKSISPLDNIYVIDLTCLSKGLFILEFENEGRIFREKFNKE